MERLTNTFSQGGKKCVPFIVAGDPDYDTSLKIMHGMVKAGASVLEIGYPFTDPVADGTVIVRAHNRALHNGYDLLTTCRLIQQFRREDSVTPVVLMGYCNPIFQLGFKKFCAVAKRSGVDGVLMVDAPHSGKYRAQFIQSLTAQQIAFIPLISLNTKPTDVARLTSLPGGYAYLVAVDGVTGSADLNIIQLKKKYKQIVAHSQLPLAIGFGISTPAQAKSIFMFADTVVIGSHIISYIEKYKKKSVQKICAFVKSIVENDSP